MADQVQKPQIPECDKKIDPVVKPSKNTVTVNAKESNVSVAFTVLDVSDDLIEESDYESEPDDWDDYPDSDDACMYYRDVSGQWRCR